LSHEKMRNLRWLTNEKTGKVPRLALSHIRDSQGLEKSLLVNVFPIS